MAHIITISISLVLSSLSPLPTTTTTGAHGLRAARGLGHRGRRGLLAEGGRHLPLPAREHGRAAHHQQQAVRGASAGQPGECM